MTSETNNTEDLSRFQIKSRRQVVSLLDMLSERSPSVRIRIENNEEFLIGLVLEVDDVNDVVIIGCAPSVLLNPNLLASDDISFEGTLENIRILFSAPYVKKCKHNEVPALSIPLPDSIIRLQRRESYRVAVPITDPTRCTFTLRDEFTGETSTIDLPIYNVSAGGIALVDEKKIIPTEVGAIHEKCRINLPGGPLEVTLQLPGGPLEVTLQFMNLQEVTLPSGNSIHRLGFMFVAPSPAVEAAVQRYITKLEREQNARATGMR